MGISNGFTGPEEVESVIGFTGPEVDVTGFTGPVVSVIGLTGPVVSVMGFTGPVVCCLPLPRMELLLLGLALLFSKS